MTRVPAVRRCRLLLPLTLLLLASCQYLGDRGMDFLDQFKIAGDAAVVGGARARHFGLYDTGLTFGLKPRATAIGMKYGVPLFFNIKNGLIDADQVAIIKGTHIYALDYGKGAYQSSWTSAAILPGVFTWGDSTPDEYEWVVPEEGDVFDDVHWIWSAEGFEQNRYAQIHAFDVELELAFILYFDTGYSPGETLDFLLGFIFIDIAGDDGRL